jgi:hypothetical protein
VLIFLDNLALQPRLCSSLYRPVLGSSVAKRVAKRASRFPAMRPENSGPTGGLQSSAGSNPSFARFTSYLQTGPLESFRAAFIFGWKHKAEPPLFRALSLSQGDGPTFSPLLQPFLTIGGGGCGGALPLPLPIGNGSPAHPARLNAARAAKTVQTNDFMTPPSVA